MTHGEARGELPASVRRWIEDTEWWRREAEEDPLEVGCLGFVAGLPVVWIALIGMDLVDPPWVLGLALPLVYLVLAGRLIRALPAKRRRAWAMLPLGSVAGLPWAYGLFLVVIVPASAVWLCGWVRRRALGRGAPPPFR
jgi:hypothetical protein